MSPEEFVEVLRLVSVDQAAEGTVSTLRSPPGRQTWPTAVRRSEWFRSLDPSDQQMVAEVAKDSAFMSAFAFCNILDGTKAFDPNHGWLKLIYVAPDGSEILLNDPSRCEPFGRPGYSAICARRAEGVPVPARPAWSCGAPGRMLISVPVPEDWCSPTRRVRGLVAKSNDGLPLHTRSTPPPRRAKSRWQTRSCLRGRIRWRKRG